MKRVTTKRRRMIEIYFVLYIAALVMLLPSKKDSLHTQTNAELLTTILRQSFTLSPDKTVLNCRIVADSSGNQIISIDSTNLIMYTGNVKDVLFECVVFDQSLHQSLRLVSNQPSPTPLFQLQNVIGKQAVEFKWMPPPNDHSNRLFLVKVIAHATPNPSINNDSLEQLMNAVGARLSAETQFSVNVIFANGGAYTSAGQIAQLNGFQKDTSNGLLNLQPNSLPPSTNRPFNVGDYFLQPQNSQVKSIAFQPWTNKIFLAGISSIELNKTPLIKLERSQNESGGTASISEIRGNEIIIGGISPSAGFMKVVLTARRESDGKEVSVDFVIQPQPILPPSIDTKMYPGQIYIINPNLPLLTDGGDVKAVLKEGNKDRVVSPQGAPFSFTPDISDTQKILTFERFVGTKQVGQSLSIRVESFPPPEVLESTLRSGVVFIQTRSYGWHNGKNNETHLEITEGNAGLPVDQRGDMQQDKKTMAILQMFRIRPLDPNKPFNFKLRAIDVRGKSSAVKSIRGD